MIEEVDIVMLLRVQHERHEAASQTSFEAQHYHEQFGFDKVKI